MKKIKYAVITFISLIYNNNAKAMSLQVKSAKALEVHIVAPIFQTCSGSFMRKAGRALCEIEENMQRIHSDDYLKSMAGASFLVIRRGIDSWYSQLNPQRVRDMLIKLDAVEHRFEKGLFAEDDSDVYDFELNPLQK